MSAQILITFKSPEDAGRCDVTRIGIVGGGSDDGTQVIVEPDIDGWDGVRDEVAVAILQAGMAVVGVWAEVEIHA